MIGLNPTYKAPMSFNYLERNPLESQQEHQLAMVTCLAVAGSEANTDSENKHFFNATIVLPSKTGDVVVHLERVGFFRSIDQLIHNTDATLVGELTAQREDTKQSLKISLSPDGRADVSSFALSIDELTDLAISALISKFESTELLDILLKAAARKSKSGDRILFYSNWDKFHRHRTDSRPQTPTNFAALDGFEKDRWIGAVTSANRQNASNITEILKSLSAYFDHKNTTNDLLDMLEEAFDEHALEVLYGIISSGNQQIISRIGFLKSKIDANQDRPDVLEETNDELADYYTAMQKYSVLEYLLKIAYKNKCATAALNGQSTQ